MIGKRETWIFIRLAAIPQPLAEAFPLNTVHQAIPKTTANSVKSAGVSSRRSRKVLSINCAQGDGENYL